MSEVFKLANGTELPVIARAGRTRIIGDVGGGLLVVLPYYNDKESRATRKGHGNSLSWAGDATAWKNVTDQNGQTPEAFKGVGMYCYATRAPQSEKEMDFLLSKQIETLQARRQQLKDKK